MTIGERLRAVRVHYGLSQSDFASKIGLKQAAIGLFENGSRNLTDRNVAIICKEYSVNENWLRTGDGNMLIEDDGTAFARFAAEYKLSDLEQAFFRVYVTLPPQSRSAVCELVKQVSAACVNVDGPASKMERAADIIDHKLMERGI